MALSNNLTEITEYRGVEGLVAAEVTNDDNGTTGYVTGNVFSIAGVAEISRTTDSSSEAHYYDNIPAITITGESADTVTISASAIPLEVFAEITGQNFDSTTGTLIEGPRTQKYFALGYKTQKTNGDEVYVWRLKGTFAIPDTTSATQNDGTDANGQELTYTGITTTHKWSKTGKGAKAINVDVAQNLANVDNFFDTVTTPDSLEAKTAYTLSITQAANTNVSVTRNGVVLTNGASIYAGDMLVISVTGGTITVNGDAFVSGNGEAVTSNVTVVSTATA